jgi:mono/diheme cytochrome c family protein
MSQVSTASTRDNSIFPLIFLIGITALLVLVFLPPVVRTTPLPVLEPTAVAEVAAAPTTAAMDTSGMDHLTLMALGLEEVNESAVKRGQRFYSTSCTACHGFDAKGISGLGKTLIGSEFVNGMHDEELVAFIIVGRQPSDPLNTTGQAMPARGGNGGLTDENIHDIVDYIRSLNGATIIDDVEDTTTVAATARPFTPLNLNAIDTSALQPSSGASGSAENIQVTPVPMNTATSGANNTTGSFTPLNLNAIDASAIQPSSGASGSASLEELTAVTPTVVPTAMPTEAPTEEATDGATNTGSGSFDVATADGEGLYGWACASCHGLDAAGMPDMPNSGLLEMEWDDAAIFTLLTQYQPPAFGVTFIHPVRGGYPELNDEQINAVIAYLRELVAP